MIHRAGTEIVNWYLLEEAGRVTIVDAGCPSYRSQLEGALAAIGRKIDDVDAIVLTHAHIDHVGFSQRLQDERGIPVYAHQEELPQAQTGKPPKTEGSFFPQLFRYPTARRVVFHIVRNAGARPPKVARVALCGFQTITGEPGPILPPREFNNSTAKARTALERIEALDAQTLYFGHGTPWTGGAAAAAAEARLRS